jgi:hypothetical protein
MAQPRALQNKAPFSPACGAYALPIFSQTGNFKGFTERAMLSAGRMEASYRLSEVARRWSDGSLPNTAVRALGPRILAQPSFPEIG